MRCKKTVDITGVQFYGTDADTYDHRPSIRYIPKKYATVDTSRWHCNMRYIVHSSIAVYASLKDWHAPRHDRFQRRCCGWYRMPRAN